MPCSDYRLVPYYRQDSAEDIRSARSSSTGVVSEAPLLRHEKVKKKAQQDAEMHRKMIDTLEGLIRSLITLHSKDSRERIQVKLSSICTSTFMLRL